MKVIRVVEVNQGLGNGEPTQTAIDHRVGGRKLLNPQWADIVRIGHAP